MKLQSASLSDLPQSVLRPVYDRQALTPGIIHIGVGNFHRAHQAWYLHRLMQKGEAQNWALIGAGVRAYDSAMRDKLLAQDCLTTLIELDPAATQVEVVGSMIDYLPIQEGNTALIARMSQPDIRIVALTVTEGGYYIDPATQSFDAGHPDMQHDAANPQAPKTAFGAMIASLKARRASGAGPFTGLCCDNLQGNGRVLRQTLVGLARLSDPELATWIDSHCSFPNSMVDCIVPATGATELALVQALGIDDQAPVTHENFRQWVIEDAFCAGRPDWDQVGATFTHDVHDYELMKIRILNGGHQVIAVPGELLSVATISGCMQHPLIADFFTKVQQTCIVPHVKPVPGMQPSAYVDLIRRRFSNPKIVDTTRRVAFDGSSRHPAFILPSIRDSLAAGSNLDGLALVEACWARMCEGSREDGSLIDANDPYWDALQERARSAKRDPSAWLAMQHIYGDLAQEPRFADAFCGWLERVWSQGLEASLAAYCED